MIARVLVAIDSADDLPVVDAACDLAREHRATLELVGGIARAAPTVALVACPKALDAELERDSRALLAQAVGRVPADIPVVWRHVHGRALLRLLRDPADEHRVVVVGRRPWWTRIGRAGRSRCLVAAAADGLTLERGSATSRRARTIA